MLLLKDAHETTREKERKQFERSLAESDKLHLATQSTLKTELGEARTRLRSCRRRTRSRLLKFRLCTETATSCGSGSIPRAQKPARRPWISRIPQQTCQVPDTHRSAHARRRHPAPGGDRGGESGERREVAGHVRRLLARAGGKRQTAAAAGSAQRQPLGHAARQPRAPRRDGGAHVSEKLLSGGALNQSMSPHSRGCGRAPITEKGAAGGRARTPGFDVCVKVDTTQADCSKTRRTPDTCLPGFANSAVSDCVVSRTRLVGGLGVKGNASAQICQPCCQHTVCVEAVLVKCCG